MEDPGVCRCSGIAEDEPIYRRVVRVDGLDEAEELLHTSQLVRLEGDAAPSHAGELGVRAIKSEQKEVEETEV